MFTVLLQAYALHPDAERPQIVEDLSRLSARYPEGVDEIVKMLGDLREFGHLSRFVHSLRRSPLFELKSKSRGGHRGGARVYFAFTGAGEALVFNAEVKSGTAPNQAKLTQAIAMLTAYGDGSLRIHPYEDRRLR